MRRRNLGFSLSFTRAFVGIRGDTKPRTSSLSNIYEWDIQQRAVVTCEHVSAEDLFMTEFTPDGPLSGEPKPERARASGY